MEIKFVKVNKVPLFAIHSKRDISIKASKILGASYEPKTKVWYYPAYYPFGIQVYEEIKMVFGNTVASNPLLLSRLEQLHKTKDRIDNREIRSDFKFKTNPMDHQIDGLMYGITHLRLGVFWDCGVGKTKLAVDLCRYLGMNVLYVCPSRLVENTRDEYLTHSFDDDFSLYPVIEKKENKLKTLNAAIHDDVNNKVVIAGYETISHSLEISDNKFEYPYFDLLQQYDYDVILFDESHKLRSINSTTSNICSKLASKAYRRLLLTGTPSLGNPLHLYVQMRILMPWRYSNYYSFKKQFVQVAPHNKKIVLGFKNLHLLRMQVDSFCIKKSKEECLDLPERSVILRKIPMSDEQKSLYNEVKEGLHTSVEYNPISVLVMTKMHQICGGTLVDSPIDYDMCKNCIQMPICMDKKIVPYSKRCIQDSTDRPVTNIFLEDNPKMDYLLALLDSMIKGEGKKVILWYKYGNEHKIITEALKKEKIKFVDYGKLKHKAVTAFQDKNSRPMVFLSQVQKSSGVTLTEATYTIYYSLTFDLEHYLQSRDRMYRKGQMHKTMEYHLMMDNSVDTVLGDRLEKKQEVNYAMLYQDLQKEIITKVGLK